MEASLCTYPSSKPHFSQTLNLTGVFTKPIFRLKTSLPITRKTSQVPSIYCAISRTKKEETVETVKKELENCYLLAGIFYKGFTVKQFQELRKSLPESVTLVVAKNTLVGKAIEGTPWEALKPCMKGMNAWLFIHTEEIPGALKPYRDFQKERKLDENDFTGAVFEGKFYGPSDFKALETMPTRAEIYAKLLGSLQSPAWKKAVGNKNYSFGRAEHCCNSRYEHDHHCPQPHTPVCTDILCLLNLRFSGVRKW
ncbi:hypothetical protein NE237_004014 [Protea cynaroides]|uniref:Large ribosomal subunit protein uL10c n=1 Tax=Protea cynaroides TaxID=273540 RepID=A0A9Q0QSZ2_9MAGN|nr:hypothetical protein NE237_004014 [Protea cynaroides]